MAHLKGIFNIKPNTVYYKNMPVKGKIQIFKKLNVGQTLSFSKYSALFLCRNKSIAAAKIPCLLICLLTSHDSKWTVHGGGSWELKIFKEQAFCLLQAAHRSPHQSHICHSFLSTMHPVSNMDSKTRTGKAWWKMR